MDINYLAIASFLGGAIVQQVINWYNKRQEYDRDLKKLTYERKLEIAEKAIAFFWTYSSKISEAKIAMQVIVDSIKEIDERDYDLEHLLKQMEETGKVILELASNNYMEINAIHFYFDLEDKEKWNENDIVTFLKDYAESKEVDNRVRYWMDLYNSHRAKNDSSKADLCLKKASEFVQKNISSYNKLISFMERNSLAVNSMIKEIKSQFKIY